MFVGKTRFIWEHDGASRPKPYVTDWSVRLSLSPFGGLRRTAFIIKTLSTKMNRTRNQGKICLSAKMNGSRNS
jgi:hypothetical protein